MKPRSTLRALSSLAILIALVIFVFWRLHAVQNVVQVGHQATVVARHLTTEADSVSTSGVDQRYRVRRDAVASMRADLLRVATSVSTFITDSGYPRTYFDPYSR